MHWLVAVAFPFHVAAWHAGRGDLGVEDVADAVFFGSIPITVTGLVWPLAWPVTGVTYLVYKLKTMMSK